MQTRHDSSFDVPVLLGNQQISLTLFTHFSVIFFVIYYLRSDIWMRRLLSTTWLIVIKLFCRDLFSVYVTMFVEGCKLDDSSVNYLIKETVLVLSVMPKISKGRVEHLILCSLVNFVKT